MKIFNINKHLSVVANAQNTRSGFRHVVTLMEDGQEIDSTKVTYQNRTWESYEFETALEKLKERNAHRLAPAEVSAFDRMIKNRGEESKAEAESMFKTTAMVAKMGEILAPDQKSKNAWKARMLKAGLNLEMPEDWESLSEDEKEKRLNEVIKFAHGLEDKGMLPMSMTAVPKLGSLGSGWHKEPVSHSYATKFGKAPKHVRGR